MRKNILLIKKYFIFAIFLIFLMKTGIEASQDFVKVRDLRLGINKEGIRLVVDVSKPCQYQVRSIKDSSVIYLEIFDAQLAEDFKMPNLTPDKMLEKIHVNQPNFSQVKITIPLAYGVPIDNVHFFTLENPNRIVIDIVRDYNKYIQFYITNNILWMQTERASDGKFTLINELFVNQKSPDVVVEVEFARGKDNREKVSDMVKRTNAIAGVNGGYFSQKGASLGLVVKNGKIAASSVKRRPPRTAIGFDFDKNIHFNRVEDRNGKLKPLWGSPWENMVLALGAGPRLIAEGKIHITDKEEGFSKGGNDITRRAGRTAVGVSKDGNLVMITASGFRSNAKDGMKLPDLAEYMKSRDIVDAMNLDGGGSTAMSILGYLVSKPPLQGNYQRPVANGLLVYDKTPIISPRYMGIDPPQLVMPADGVTEKMLRILVTDAQKQPVPDGTAVTFASGVGMFPSKTYYTKNGLVDIQVKSLRAPGNYSIKVECGPIITFLSVKLQYGKPNEVLVNAKVLENIDYPKAPREDDKIVYYGKKFLLESLVRDEFKNPIKGKTVEFNILRGEGSFSCDKSITRADGIADTTFSLKSTRALVQVSAANLPNRILEFER
ncbi:MAG: phosphodiester glycosidase family protein [Vulcanimicrobiota bacterium]